MGPTLLMGPKGRYTIIEQSNTLLKESLHILCPAWAPHTLLVALISIAFLSSLILSLSSLILSLSSLASLLTSLAIILPRVMCANDECFVHWLSGILFTFRTQREDRTYTKLEWLFYRICLFTLRAQRDARTYTSTTDQCGARSGSPQLPACSYTPVKPFEPPTHWDTNIYIYICMYMYISC